MTLARLWTVLAVALPTLGALLANLPSVDLAFQLRAGAEIIEAGRVPSIDSWTYTVTGQPWHDQPWLAQVILALTYQLGGWTGLALLRAALVAGMFGLLALTFRRRNPGLSSRTRALLVLAAFAVSAAALALRPQLLGMTCFAATIAVLGERHARPRLLWLLPLIAAAWANIHGSFVLLPLLVGLTWLEDSSERAPGRARLLAIGLVALGATALTPSGPGVWGYAIGLAGDPAIAARVSEWRPPTVRDGPGLLFWGSVALVVLLLARRPVRTPWPALAWLGTFAALGALAARGVAWWPLVAAYVVAGLLVAEAPPARAPRPRPLNAAITGALVVAGVLLVPAWRPLDPALDAPAGVVAIAPGGITRELQTLAVPGDRLWAPQVWGSWFEFAVPDAAVAVDSRIELFPARVWESYDAVADGGPDALGILEHDGVRFVVAADRQASLRATLDADPAWRLVHRDADGALWVSVAPR